MRSYFQIAYVYSKGGKIIWHAWLESWKLGEENVRNLRCYLEFLPTDVLPTFPILISGENVCGVKFCREKVCGEKVLSPINLSSPQPDYPCVI